MRHVYIVGRNSVLKNLPRPNVTMVNNHSCVSIKQCIAHFFAASKMPEKKSDKKINVIHNISDSKTCKEVYERAYIMNSTTPKEGIVVLMGLSWSDDFEPNSSIKANRGGVWIRTVIFISDTFCDNKLEDTYTISIGLKQNNHDVIEEKFLSELQDLSTGKDNKFYSMKRKSIGKVHFEIIAFRGDQPETISINKLMLGNSTFGARYLYAVNVKLIAKYLPLYNICLDKTKRDRTYISRQKKFNNCL
jgi:hypothetical protein